MSDEFIVSRDVAYAYTPEVGAWLAEEMDRMMLGARFVFDGDKLSVEVPKPRPLPEHLARQVVEIAFIGEDPPDLLIVSRSEVAGFMKFLKTIDRAAADNMLVPAIQREEQPPMTDDREAYEDAPPVLQTLGCHDGDKWIDEGSAEALEMINKACEMWVEDANLYTCLGCGAIVQSCSWAPQRLCVDNFDHDWEPVTDNPKPNTFDAAAAYLGYETMTVGQHEEKLRNRRDTENHLRGVR